MRVSLPICIASCVFVIVLSWWLNTRSRDFLTAPNDAELNRTRIAAEQTNPTAQGMGDALSPITSPEDQAPIAVVLPEHVNKAPQLGDYRNEVRHGVDYLMELAKLLKAEHPERALTCWERIIDSCKIDDSQRDRAAREIIRLKKKVPFWNENPDHGIIVIIQAGTGPTTATILEPILEQVADNLRKTSSGILTAQAKVSAGEEDLADEGQAPIAIWISGPEENSPSTDILSFSHPVDQADGLSAKVTDQIYRMIRLHLVKMDDFQPLPKAGDRYSSDKLLEGHISRMVWKNLAESLQATP